MESNISTCTSSLTSYQLLSLCISMSINFPCYTIENIKIDEMHSYQDFTFFKFNPNNIYNCKCLFSNLNNNFYTICIIATTYNKDNPLVLILSITLGVGLPLFIFLLISFRSLYIDKCYTILYCIPNLFKKCNHKISHKYNLFKKYILYNKNNHNKSSESNTPLFNETIDDQIFEI